MQLHICREDLSSMEWLSSSVGYYGTWDVQRDSRKQKWSIFKADAPRQYNEAKRRWSPKISRCKMGKIAKAGRPGLPWRELKGRFLQLLYVIVTGYAINHRSVIHFLCYFTKLCLQKTSLTNWAVHILGFHWSKISIISWNIKLAKFGNHLTVNFHEFYC